MFTHETEQISLKTLFAQRRVLITGKRHRRLNVGTYRFIFSTLLTFGNYKQNFSRTFVAGFVGGEAKFGIFILGLWLI